MNDASPPHSGELAFAPGSAGTPQSAAETLSRKTKLLLLTGGVALLAFDIGFFLWWRQWAWGNRIFLGHAGTAVVKQEGRSVALSRREVLDEATQHFTYEGQPIHPAIIHAFSSWMSDSATAVMAMDVSTATYSNQYGQEVKTSGNGLHEIILETEADSGEKSTFGYWYLGALRDGSQVLETVECGGGTGQFMDLLVLRCEVVTISGQDRLLLKYLDRFSLGDRFTGEIELRSDHVAIEAQPLNPYRGLQESTTFFPKLARW